MDEQQYEHEVYDSQDEEEEHGKDEIHQTTGDTGQMLVLKRSCITPRRNDDQWLRTNIFRSTCNINNRVCTFVIDSGSCRNVISEEAVTKLGLLRETHPSPYTLGWLNDSANVRVSQRTLVSFSIGPYYADRIYCDVVPMDICHLLLGRPWEYDRKVLHSGADNTYQFTWNTHKILLLPSKEPAVPLTSQPVPTQTAPRTQTVQSTNIICSYASFLSELRS